MNLFKVPTWQPVRDSNLHPVRDSNLQVEGTVLMYYHRSDVLSLNPKFNCPFSSAHSPVLNGCVLPAISNNKRRYNTIQYRTSPLSHHAFSLECTASIHSLSNSSYEPFLLLLLLFLLLLLCFSQDLFPSCCGLEHFKCIGMVYHNEGVL